MQEFKQKRHALVRAILGSALAVAVTACGGGGSGGGNPSTGEGDTGVGGPVGGCDRFVDASATGADDGSSWSDAFNHLQDALDEANANLGTDFTVCVAKGIYRPDSDKNGDHTNNDVLESFTFKGDNAQLYGGFPAGGGDRDPVANPTVLTGDIDNNDTTNSDGLVISNSDVSGANSHHVVELIGDDGTPITTNTRIDGFYITAGDNRFGSGGDEAGGGVFCKISGSSASCNPRLVRVVFQGNRAYSAGGAHFEALNGATVSPEFVNVQFRNNYGDNASSGCNFSLGSGSSGQPTFVNTLFTGSAGNAEAFRGGAYSNASIKPTFVNSAFVNNNAGSLYNYQASSTETNETLIVNTIIWGNGSSLVDNGTSSTIRNSIVEGGWSGNGGFNLAQDPQFVDAKGPDGTAGTPDDDLRLQAGSPAIDAGEQQDLLADTTDLDYDDDTNEDTPLDIFGNARVQAVNSSEVDIGVHEYDGS